MVVAQLRRRNLGGWPDASHGEERRNGEAIEARINRGEEPDFACMSGRPGYVR
jgi:hypothetical protein